MERFPLQWPEGWPRTPSGRRKVSRYSVSMERAMQSLSTNIPLRRDGKPYASAPAPLDPGVAIYWTNREGKPCVIACDQYLKVHHNVRAIALAVDALRALDRCGASQILDRAFQGFAALPASVDAPRRRPWREVFGFHVDTSHASLRSLVVDRYRHAARTAHPDTGGSNEAFVELGQALEEAKKELGIR
jgi:hypothetical protein